MSIFIITNCYPIMLSSPEADIEGLVVGFVETGASVVGAAVG